MNDQDIDKYLSLIKKSKSENAAAAKSPASVSSPGNGNPKIDPSCDIRGIERMAFGKNVVIQKDCWLNIAYNNPAPGPMIVIDEGTNIGRRCTLSAANKISIGKFVLIAPDVFIADTHHEHVKIGIPIMNQGITTHHDQVVIGDGTWIGINAAVMGNVRIGKNCVIGANSVVTHDIPDYAVAVGTPARIIKLFDVESGRWIRIENSKKIEYHLAKRENLLEYVIPFAQLRSLQVEVSSACNLKCPQCFSHIEGHHTGLFSKTLWDEKILPILSQLTDVHLVGIGEPLLHRDFFHFVEDARRANVEVHTTSNLQLVDEKIAERIVKSGIKKLSFSCDGATKETYEQIRIKGSFAKLQESLSLINGFKRTLKTEFPHLILNFGGTRRNIHELPLVVDLAKKNQVSSIIAYHNVIYLEGLKDESLYHHQALSDEKFIEAKQHADSLDVAMFLPGLFAQPIKYQSGKIYCGYPYRHLYIYSNGLIGPCCMDFPDRYVLGDINDSSLEEVWNSMPFLKLRHELSCAPSETCRHCVNHGKMDITDPGFFFRFKGSCHYIKRLSQNNICGAKETT